MNKYLKKMLKEETGGAMVLALLMLAVGSLLIIPMMALSDSTLDASQMYQRKTAEIYAAHGGLEEALWQVKYGDLEGFLRTRHMTNMISIRHGVTPCRTSSIIWM